MRLLRLLPALLLAACGQSGDLYLPAEQPKPAAAPAAPLPEPAPAEAPSEAEREDKDKK